jgi:hypothetical protein
MQEISRSVMLHQMQHAQPGSSGIPIPDNMFRIQLNGMPVTHLANGMSQLSPTTGSGCKTSVLHPAQDMDGDHNMIPVSMPLMPKIETPNPFLQGLAAAHTAAAAAAAAGLTGMAPTAMPGMTGPGLGRRNSSSLPGKSSLVLLGSSISIEKGLMHCLASLFAPFLNCPLSKLRVCIRWGICCANMDTSRSMQLLRQ